MTAARPQGVVAMRRRRIASIRIRERSGKAVRRAGKQRRDILHRDPGAQGGDNPGYETGSDRRDTHAHTGRTRMARCSRIICRSGGFDAVPPERSTGRTDRLTPVRSREGNPAPDCEKRCPAPMAKLAGHTSPRRRAKCVRSTLTNSQVQPAATMPDSTRIEMKMTARDHKNSGQQQKKSKKLPGGDKAGPDGTVYQVRRVKTGTQAIQTHKVRCRPGTFEWRYGRFGNAQYHAGAEFARLWERAGVASASGINFEASGGGGGFGGLPDARTLAMDRIRGITQEIGGPMARRLVSYCVEGRTPKEIAASYRPQLQVSDRQVSDTLDLDLHELAKAMNYA